jgi:hypothetical protein
MSFANPAVGIVFDITYMAIFMVGYMLINGIGQLAHRL